MDVTTIQRAWDWTGIDPVAIVLENDFGNLMVRDSRGRYWRVCPEELRCTIVAGSDSEYHRLIASDEFGHDWGMVKLCEEGHALLGPLPPGRKYCLKIPAPLGGAYGGDNLGTISFEELIRASGDMARQIDGLDDGTPVRVVVTE